MVLHVASGAQGNGKSKTLWWKSQEKEFAPFTSMSLKLTVWQEPASPRSLACYFPKIYVLTWKLSKPKTLAAHIINSMNNSKVAAASHSSGSLEKRCYANSF